MLRALLLNNHRYAEMLGFGEKAGMGIEGEQPGLLPLEAPKYGGVGMMTSFGTGISMTPLELAALLGAISNGGTLYYLQYPHTQEEVDQYAPKVKRPLKLAPTGIEDIKWGMRGAVDFGTARRAGYDATEPILGKTGTCTDFQTASHMGWFGSFNEVGAHRLVVLKPTGVEAEVWESLGNALAGAFSRLGLAASTGDTCTGTLAYCATGREIAPVDLTSGRTKAACAHPRDEAVARRCAVDKASAEALMTILRDQLKGLLPLR